MKPYGRSGVIWRATALSAALLAVGGLAGGCRSSGGTGGRPPSTLPGPSTDSGPGGGGGMAVAVARPPEGEVRWSFEVRPAKEGAVIDMTGAALVCEGMPVERAQRGILVVAGPAQTSGSAAGGGITHDYKAGVATPPVAGHTLRLTYDGQTL